MTINSREWLGNLVPGLLATSLAVLFLTTISLAAGSGQSPVLRSAPVVFEKAAEVLPVQVSQFLKQRDDQSALVWVFFSDKGVFDQTSFDKVAAGVVLTDRAQARRSKVGLGHPAWIDLPVYQTYLDQLLELGAVHRRSSRWLNAVSIDISLDLLEPISRLPFVISIRPVARSLRPVPVPDVEQPDRPTESLAPDDLNYGPSQAQITQINGVVAHARGLSGAGVTIAIMDTGFRTSHDAFASHLAAGRVLAEYDFVNNDSITSDEPGDSFNHANHGTMTWATCGGSAPGHIIGPAFGANFILCKTEDLTSETPVEEDNWVAALEFADSIGTDVISNSLAYLDWYTYPDIDGHTAVITLAANLCDGLGIVMCTAAGNEGPAAGTIFPPADAFNILAVGGVDAGGSVVGFSSRGPTYDGRIKPEVCALGTGVYAASGSGDGLYRYGSGTSFSTPLVAGATAVLIEARPELIPAMIREALMTTADHADQIDNNYGSGIINLGKALDWPVAITVDNPAGQVPLTVSLANESYLETDSLVWDFGDGTTSSAMNPAHTYESPGVFDLTLTIYTGRGPFTRVLPSVISAHSDTLWIEHAEGEPFRSNRVDIYATNFLPLKEITIPFSWSGAMDLTLDSFSTAGLRSEFFDYQSYISYDAPNKRATLLLKSLSNSRPAVMPPGQGPIASLYLNMPIQPGNGSNEITIRTDATKDPGFISGDYAYLPAIRSGSLRLGCCLGTVGDIDGDGAEPPSLGDITVLIDHLFINQLPLECYEEADINQSGGVRPDASDITLGDVALLIDHLFITGPSLLLPDCL